MESVLPAKRRHSITFRMTVAVCAFLILFQAVLAVSTFFYVKRELQQSITSQQITLLTVVCHNIDQKLLASLKVVVDVSRLVTPDIIRDSETAQKFLDNRPGTHSIFDNGLFLFSAEGRIIAEAPFRPERRGRDVSFREYFKRTIASGQPSISEPYVSTHTPGAPAVMFTAPVRDKSGKLIAVLGGSLNLLQDNFLGQLSRTTIAETGYLYITTRSRTMIMHPDKTRIMQLAAPPGVNLMLDRAINGFEGAGENVNSRKLKSLSAFKHLKTTDWIVVANHPVNEAYAPILNVQKYLMVLILV